MKYERFEDLPVWRDAVRLYESIDDLLGESPSRLSRSFRDQLERAVLSVSNNIAEGFERGTTNEVLTFLYIARGSAGEVRSMLCILERRPWMEEFRSQIAMLKSLAESCSRQLRAWADSLQNSAIKGQRHLNDAGRDTERRRKEATEFEKELLQHLPPGHPARVQAEKQGKL